MTIAASQGPAPATPDAAAPGHVPPATVPPTAAPGPASRPGVPAQAVPAHDDIPWEELAACRGADPELFFPVSSTGPSLAQIRRAKAVCAGCPVREACLAYALDTRQEFGIWGGLDEQERRRLRREIQPRRVPAAPRR
jgi:WhiB family transcriptional regulator, redox-sensing transcriptional regulator